MFVKTPFLQNNTGRLFQITTVSIAVKEELAIETVNYYTEIKTPVRLSVVHTKVN